MELPIVSDKDGYYSWLVMHGVEIVFSHGLMCARVNIPCSRLENGRCTIYDNRPQMCRDYKCERETDV
jgi:Fe-S-cluster containining protein